MTGRLLWRIAAGGIAGLFLTGCAPTTRISVLPEPRPPGAKRNAADMRALPDEPKGNVTLQDAVAMALRRNPQLAARSDAVRAAEARYRQAGVWPNPEIEVEVEEYDRNGEGFDSSEMAVVLAQAFELGGKRRWRRQVARSEGELVGWDYESTRLDVFAETARRFVGVLAAQERLQQTRSAVELARKTSAAVGERVTAGTEPPLQASKSEAELDMVRLDVLSAQKGLDVSRAKLAAMWGADGVAFDAVEGNLGRVLDAVPSLSSLRPKLDANPDFARWEAEHRLRRAALAAAKAARVPDLETSVGYLQYEEDGTDAFAFGFGVPLPLFDRNHGTITAARHELAQADREQAVAELRLVTALRDAHAVLASAHERVGTLRRKVVPAMQAAHRAAHEGYKQGKFGFLEALDAQRGLLQARARLLDALIDYRFALIDIQRITATGLHDLNNKNRKE